MAELPLHFHSVAGPGHPHHRGPALLPAVLSASPGEAAAARNLAPPLHLMQRVDLMNELILFSTGCDTHSKARK